MRALFIVLIATLGLNLGTTFAQASCFADEPLADKAARADLIAYGRLNGDQFAIRQVLKGSASGVITVQLGPEKGVITSIDYMTVDGTDNVLYLRLVDGAYVTDACSGSHVGMATEDERSFFGLGTDGEVWTMDGGSGQVDGVTSFGLDQAGTLAVALVALAAAALAAITALRTVARKTA